MAVADESKGGQGKGEQTYPMDRLVAEAHDRLGVPPHVAAGAFALKGGSKKNFTVDEAKKAVKDFEKYEVEVDNPIARREN
jgi:hypothetical protein